VDRDINAAANMARITASILRAGDFLARPEAFRVRLPRAAHPHVE